MNFFSTRDTGRSRLIFSISLIALIVAAASCRPDSGEYDNAKAKSDAAVRVSPDGKNTSEPAIATAQDGSVFVVYVTHEPDKSSDLFLAKVGSDLRPSGDGVRINPSAGDVKSWYGDPPTIAISGNGTVYVGWTRGQPLSSGTDLVLSVSHDGGRSFDDPVKVNDDAIPAAHGMHSLAVDGGRIYMTWLDERNVKAEKAELQETLPSPMKGFEFVKAHHEPTQNAASDDGAEPNSEVFFAYSTDGGQSFSRNIRVASHVCPCCKTTTLAAAGKIYLSWRQVLQGNFRHIAVASSSDGGKTFTKDVIVSDDKWMLSACPVSGAALATNAAGELSVYWYTAGAAGEPGIYTARSTDGGRTFGERQLIDGRAASGIPAVINTGGDFADVVVAEDNGQTVAIRVGDGKVSRKYADATLPAASGVGRDAVVAFVRKEGNGRSVWLAR